MRKNKLSNMEIDSVDLCKKGANQKAHIKLYKSAPGGENDMEQITKSVGAAQVRETTGTLCKSLESIIADDSLSAVEKQQMMKESLLQFADEASSLMEGWAASVGKAEDPGEDPEDFDGGADENDQEEEDDMDENTMTVGKAVIDIGKMSPEDKIAVEALAKKYGGDAAGGNEPAIHPDVRKALDEVAELRKSMELEKLEGVAKKYEIIGKKAPELARKLYDLKQAGEQHYNDYVALLDEQVAMANSGIYKEYGSSRSATDLSATVAEVVKANPNMTREQAIVQAFESNPALDPFTGRVK